MRVLVRLLFASSLCPALYACGSSGGGAGGQDAEADGVGDSGTVVILRDGSSDVSDSTAPMDAPTTDSTTPKDAPAGDAPTDAGPDGTESGAPLGAGTLLVPGDAVAPWVITSDGLVVYANDATGVAAAVPATGGASVQIAAGTPGQVAIKALHPNLLASAGYGGGAGAIVVTNTLVPDGGVPDVPFTTWSLAGGSHAYSGARNTSLTGSKDGAHFTWVSLDAATRKGTFDLTTSTGTLALATGFTAPPYPLPFFGGTGGLDLIVGFASGVLEAVNAATGVTTNISMSAQTNAGSVVVDPTGAHVAYFDSSGALWVATAPTYASVQVGTSNNLQSFPYFSPDGSTLYFADANGVIYRSPVSGPNPVTVVSGAAGGIYNISPDGSWLLTTTTNATNPYNETDMQIVSAQASGGTLATIDATARVWSNWFSSDSSHILEASNPATPTGETGGFPNVPVCTLTSYDIASHTMSAAITTTLLGSVMPAAGTVSVFYDNPQPATVAGRFVCDLRSVDVAATSPTATVIQSGVQCGAREGVAVFPAAPLLGPDGKTIAYGLQGTTAQPGIYVYKLP